MSVPDPTTVEAPEVRDGDEIAEEQARTVRVGVPIGIDGRPMTMISASVSDKVPTVQYGNVVVGPVTIVRYIDDFGDGSEGRQHRIDQARQLQRDAEFVVGIERRLAQYAVDPSSRIGSPIPEIAAQDAFAAAPPGYNPNQISPLPPTHDPVAVPVPAGVPAPPPPPPPPVPVAAPASPADPTPAAG